MHLSGVLSCPPPLGVQVGQGPVLGLLTADDHCPDVMLDGRMRQGLRLAGPHLPSSAVLGTGGATGGGEGGLLQAEHLPLQLWGKQEWRELVAPWCVMDRGTTDHSNPQCSVTPRDLGHLAEGGLRRVPGFSLPCCVLWGSQCWARLWDCAGSESSSAPSPSLHNDSPVPWPPWQQLAPHQGSDR